MRDLYARTVCFLLRHKFESLYEGTGNVSSIYDEPSYVEYEVVKCTRCKQTAFARLGAKASD